MNASKDENSAVFTEKQQPASEKLRDALHQAITVQHSPRMPAATPVPVVDELAKLAQLAQQGVICQAEFEQQKARLLAQ
ncbi:SHOCT domain-containing protein [Streptomyces rimosus]|uniref:SHOCT domain-containing protein n=1 Tax=Streptomyces rimosus TaxID=1927 RepID=UPI001F3B6C76|nr:SHOCT domain-containing protein [Streptomyces rimosus]